MSSRFPALVLLLAGVLALGVLAPAARAEATLDDAEAALARLEDKMDDKKSINEELIAGLDEVMEYYRNLKPPEKPEPQPIPDDASEEQKEEIEKENKKAIRDWEGEVRKYDRKAGKFKKDVRDALLDAFTLVRANRSTKMNEREDVNIKAAELLATLNEDPEIAEEVSEDIIKAMERDIFEARFHDVTELLLDKGFSALGHLNQEKALKWMIEEFTHAKSSPTKEVMKLQSAHRAMPLFTKVPGSVRYELVDEMIKTYSSVESQAETSSNDPNILAKKQFWDRIKNDVIKVVQYYTGEPVDDQGQVIARMDAFRDWFRDHDNKRRPPWVDPEEE